MKNIPKIKQSLVNTGSWKSWTPIKHHTMTVHPAFPHNWMANLPGAAVKDPSLIYQCITGRICHSRVLESWMEAPEGGVIVAIRGVTTAPHCHEWGRRQLQLEGVPEVAPPPPPPISPTSVSQKPIIAVYNAGTFSESTINTAPNYISCTPSVH